MPEGGESAVVTVDDGLVYGVVAGDWVALDARTGEDAESGSGSAPIAVNSFGGAFSREGSLTWAPRVDAE